MLNVNFIKINQEKNYLQVVKFQNVALTHSQIINERL